MTTNEVILSLTPKGRETMQAIGNRQTSFFDNGIAAGSGIYGQVLTEEMGHRSSGVIVQLTKMGLFTAERVDGVNGTTQYDNWLALTELGAAVARELASR